MIFDLSLPQMLSLPFEQQIYLFIEKSYYISDPGLLGVMQVDMVKG